MKLRRCRAFNFLFHFEEVESNFFVKFIYTIDRDGIIENGDNEGPMADAAELPFATTLHEESGKDCGEFRKASSRFSLVADYGNHP